MRTMRRTRSAPRRGAVEVDAVHVRAEDGDGALGLGAGDFGDDRALAPRVVEEADVDVAGGEAGDEVQDVVACRLAGRGGVIPVVEGSKVGEVGIHPRRRQLRGQRLDHTRFRRRGEGDKGLELLGNLCDTGCLILPGICDVELTREQDK